MGEKVSPVISIILLFLTIVAFILPVFIGSDYIIFFFLLSFIFLIATIFVSVDGLKKNKKDLSDLALFSLIVSLIFLWFLIIVAVLV